MLSTYEQLIQGFLDKGFESVDNWLTHEELVGLRKSLLTHYENDNFHTAGIGNKLQLQTIENIRNDHIYWVDFSKANEFEQMFHSKMSAFVDYLNRTCFAGIRSFEFQYAVYNKGSFYKKHVDRFQNDDKRQFSMVFYLSEDWRDGDGGELLLYLENSTHEIKPVPGRMIFFQSDIPHEVLVSNRMRLSLTGWLKSR